MATTAINMISSSLRLIGALAAGEQIALEDAADALVTFQQMVDSWNADRLAIFSTDSQDFPLVAGKQSYTMGLGGDFNVARPARIDNMSAIIMDNPDTPVEIPMNMFTVEEWQQQVPVKNVQSNFPQICYDDGGFPFRTLSMWPQPNQTTNLVRIYSWEALSSPIAYTTPIAFPPGYAEAFRFNLAVRLAPEYGRSLDPAIATVAAQSLGRVKSMNVPDIFLRSDLLSTADGYNWSSDMFGNPFQ